MTTQPVPRPYTAISPRTVPSSDELRDRVPGWGVDLDPAERPAVPRERIDLEPTGAHWTVPERQPEFRPRERSIEHGMLPPVFGTSQPLHGISGIIRRTSYARYSEARAAHWLLLILADRVDVVENVGRSLISRHPDNPLVGTGLRAELTHHGLGERLGSRRADTLHHALDPVVVAGPWLLGGWLAARLLHRLRHKGLVSG